MAWVFQCDCCGKVDIEQGANWGKDICSDCQRRIAAEVEKLFRAKIDELEALYGAVVHKQVNVISFLRYCDTQSHASLKKLMGKDFYEQFKSLLTEIDDTKEEMV